MNRILLGIFVTGMLTLVPATAPARAAESAPPEGGATMTLEARLDALQARVAELEARLATVQVQPQSGAPAPADVERRLEEQQEAIDRATDALAQTRASVGEWVGRFQWKGDLRYRNEMIDQEFTASDRVRDRIRLRAGFVAKVNDTVRVEMQAATAEAQDARSSNQSLTNANSRKPLDLDVAYAEWSPNANWKLTAGKMRYPWVRAGQSLFFDGDVNPEGLALGWQQGPTGFFGNVFYTQLAERSAQADSNLAGAQIGWRGEVADGVRLTAGLGYFDHGAVQGYNPFQDGNPANAFGNTTTSLTAICRRGITSCLANDYNVVELFGDVSMTLAGRPLSFFADIARNDAADFASVSTNPVQNQPSGLDSAYSVGFQYGRASSPRSWEFSYIHQKIEKDALFSQWIDSDFAAGNTDGEGGLLRVGYAFARNFRLNATYYLNKTNIDVPVSLTPPGATAPIAVADRDYKRLQLDLNFGF